MNIRKIIYWIGTLGLCGLMLYSAQMYFFNTEAVEGYFEFLKYPSYIVIPLAVAKVLAVIMVLWRVSPWLTEWAYAGLFFDMVLAFAAHQVSEGGGGTAALLGLVFLLTSYFFGKELRGK